MARGLGDKKGTRVLYCSSCAVTEGGGGEGGERGGREGEGRREKGNDRGGGVLFVAVQEETRSKQGRFDS